MQPILFGDLLREWWEKYMLKGNVDYAHESWRRLEREVLPELGNREAKKITPPMVLKILRKIEARGTPVPVRKIKSHISQAMRYGIACGHVMSDPTRDLGWALAPYRSTPRAAILEAPGIGRLMYDINNVRRKKRKLSLRLLAYTFVRPGELVSAEWREIDLNEAIWRIAAEKMKMKRPHFVPLCRQALETLRELRDITGSSAWLFPSSWNRDRHEKASVLTFALRRMGYDGKTMTAHGFRAMAATSLSDMGYASELIEKQLAHLDNNRVRAAYQRSGLLEGRKEMLQTWADFLDMQWAKVVIAPKNQRNSGGSCRPLRSDSKLSKQ